VLAIQHAQSMSATAELLVKISVIDADVNNPGFSKVFLSNPALQRCFPTPADPDLFHAWITAVKRCANDNARLWTPSFGCCLLQ